MSIPIHETRLEPLVLNLLRAETVKQDSQIGRGLLFYTVEPSEISTNGTMVSVSAFPAQLQTPISQYVRLVVDVRTVSRSHYEWQNALEVAANIETFLLENATGLSQIIHVEHESGISRAADPNGIYATFTLLFVVTVA